MPKLTDTQLILLSTPAQREDGNVMPLPESLTASATTSMNKAIGQLIKQGRVEEGEIGGASLAWRSDGDIRFGARIADAGRAALGLADPSVGDSANPPARNAAPTAKKQTKGTLLLELLQRKDGATLNELVVATG